MNIGKRPTSFAQFPEGIVEIENEPGHFNLRNDLMEHLWKFRCKRFSNHIFISLARYIESELRADSSFMELFLHCKFLL